VQVFPVQEPHRLSSFSIASEEDGAIQHNKALSLETVFFLHLFNVLINVRLPDKAFPDLTMRLNKHVS
jgi:hypothetical protein